MVHRDDAVKILQAGGLTRLQATQFCGRGLTISVDAICKVLSLRNTQEEDQG